MSNYVLDRIADKFTVGDECWEWTGTVGLHGYGMVSLHRRSHLAHRVLYELMVGAIPDGLHLDHLCRRRVCVRPSHLEPVTLAENNRRAGAAKTHCPRGHEYDDRNTYRRPSGARVCRACRRTRWVKP